MSKLYLHKKLKYIFHTFKDTIIIDLDKIKDSYEYEKNILKKHPKHLIITGKEHKDFYNLHFWHLPVEDITINCDINTYAKPFYGFYNATKMKIEEDVKQVNMIKNLGIYSIRNISIPFTINNFKNNCNTIKNNLNLLCVYNKDDKRVIYFDKNFKEDKIKIEANKVNDHLIIKTTNDKNNIEYDVYLKDNKLMLDKKYNKYEINANDYDSDIKELNIIDLKKKYNEISFKGHFYYIRKVILNKDDIHYLASDLFRYLNDIEIIEENDMSLLPRKTHLTLNKDINEYIEEIEILKDNLLIKTNNSIRDAKYIIISNDLAAINIEKDDIERIVIDYDRNNFQYEDNVLTIPDKIFRASKKSKILNELIKKCKYIDDVKVILNGKKYFIDLKKVFNDEVNVSSKIKQYKVEMYKAKIHRKRRYYE